MPVFIACMGSNSARTRNDCAVPTVATPLSVTVTKLETNVNTEETTGAGLPDAGVTITIPLRTSVVALDRTTFVAERGAME